MKKKDKDMELEKKAYEQLQHDVVLWHFVHDQRSQIIESALDAECWIATVDYRFLGFDAYKINRSRGEFPVCLHPSMLIQLLQFWVPRTSEFEEMLYGSWLWPLLFQEFDPEMERATIRILKTMARFEDVGDLPTEILDQVLVNEALRQRMSSEGDTGTQTELVREAFIQEATRLEEELKTAADEAKEKESQIVEQEQQIRDQDQTIETEKQRVTELEQRLEEKVDLELKRKERSKFVLGWIVLPTVAVLLLGAGMSYVLDKWLGWGFWKPAIASWGVLLIVGMWLTDRKGSSNPVIAEHPLFKGFHGFKNWFFGTIVVGVLVALFAEAIKQGVWP